MKTEISKLPLKEWKHSLGVFLQMGRVQLDSDWNEQTETSLRLLQRQTGDVVGTGSPNFGFRVDDRILLSAMDSVAAWSVDDPNGMLYVDHFDFHVGEGSISLVTTAVTATLTRKLAVPRDISQWEEIVVAAKFSGAVPVFFLGQGANVGNVTLTPDVNTVDGWTILRGHPADAKVANPAIDLTKVDEYGFTQLAAGKYQFDYLKIDAPIRQLLVVTESPDAFTPTTANPGDIPQLTLNETDRFEHSFVLEVTNVTGISYELPAVEDLSHVRAIIVAARTAAGPPPAVTFSLTDAANINVALAGAVVATVGSWQVYSFPVPQGGINWKQVKSVQWTGLTPATIYRLAPVLVESELEGNLVIMGGDGTSDGAGRFYGDGLAAIKESNETYFSQRDLPEADPSSMVEPAAGNTRADLAYLDLWQRPITYIEDPDVREIALNGADTCTRKKLIAQVRILKGTEVNLGATPVLPDLSVLPEIGKGVLTTKDKSDAVADPCADPCEPAIAGTFLGEDNRLFRVEVHTCGQIGAAAANTTATFKWSRENAAVATAIIANADAGAFGVKVEKPELFSVGDLIEISNDLVDLITGPYEDTVNHRCHQRGELRKISSISLDDRLISWQDAMSPEPQFHAALALPERLVFHPSIRRWDAILPATPGDIILADGVVIEFGGSDMVPGDYWVFTTRVIDRSVERLVEHPPHGIRHRYFPLARVLRSHGAGSPPLVTYDLRRPFDALTTLKAAEVAYDPTFCVQDDPTWAGVTNVQQALDAICRTELDASIEDHNKYLHGSGVVCGLQLHCDTDDRNSIILEKGYALDCDGHIIRVRSPMDFDVVTAAKNGGFLDNTGFGKVLVTMTRDMVQDAKLAVELSPVQTFWQKVLEGTLLEDFWVNCILDVITFFKYEFLNPTTPVFPAKTFPAPDNQKLFISVLNLFWQMVQPASGQYIFLSKHANEIADDNIVDCSQWPGCPDVTKPQPPPVVSTSSEHHLLKGFYCCLRDLIASKTYCAEFDKLTAFPNYPYINPLPGIDTVFGLFQGHTRIRLHPTSQLAYTCGSPMAPCNQIFVFDLNTRALINVLDFPGGTNIEVMDVAVSPDGTQLYAVAILGQDSVFATATINTANNTYTWGPTSMICDKKFVTLGTSPVAAHKGNLYAVELAQGLHIFTPPNFPPAPPADVPFNATGMMYISANPDIAIVGVSSQPIGTVSTTFNTCSSISLALPGLGASFSLAPLGGTDSENDIAMSGGNVYITATFPAGTTKGLFKFPVAGGAPTATIDLATSNVVRLAPSPDGHWMFVSALDLHKVERVDISGNAPVLDKAFRIPVQIFPVAMAQSGQQLYVWNFFSFTLSLIDLPSVLAVLPPNYYTLEPPASLSAYRTQMLNAFSDLFKTFGIYLKDCFCERFLIDCPDCQGDDKVYLGEVEIQDNKVFKICNFTKRRYVKSVQLMEYWLSTVPILPIIKTALADFCCKVI